MGTSGGKQELTERIAVYLDSGHKDVAPPCKKKPTGKVEVITLDTLIEKNIVCSETHRAFFRREIGKGFSFNVGFQKWLKANYGKTYGEAIEAYRHILKEKKASPQPIGRQFEYNAYIRDFFADNPGASLDDAIRCWRYKKVIAGNKRYEREDLDALERR